MGEIIIGFLRDCITNIHGNFKHLRDDVEGCRVEDGKGGKVLEESIGKEGREVCHSEPSCLNFSIYYELSVQTFRIYGRC